LSDGAGALSDAEEDVLAAEPEEEPELFPDAAPADLIVPPPRRETVEEVLADIRRRKAQLEREYEARNLELWRKWEAEHPKQPPVPTASLVSRKTHDPNDVMLNPLVFHNMRKVLKFKPSVDLFASEAHHQLPRYFSRFPDPKAVGVDAFKANWATERAIYANPPWPLVERVLKKIQKEKVRAMVVVPDWPWAHWFPLWKSMVEKQEVLTDPIFLDSQGRLRPKPRWNTRVGILDGRC